MTPDEELRHLRQQVTELQNRCTELMLEARDMRWKYACSERAREVLAEELNNLEALHGSSILWDVIGLFDALGQEDDVQKPGVCALPSDASLALARRLIEEEVGETLTAIDARDLPEIADGVIDSIVVLVGLAVRCGLPLARLWHEVHQSNISKRGGPVNEHGKRLKPPGWVPPDIEGVLRKHGWTP